jgi:hypothetical protein
LDTCDRSRCLPADREDEEASEFCYSGRFILRGNALQ